VVIVGVRFSGNRVSMFKAPIAHGMLIAGYVSKVFGSDFPGPGYICVAKYKAYKASLY